MDSDPRAAMMRALSRFIIADMPLGETLTNIASITMDALPAAAFAGMTLLDDRARPTTAVFTDQRSPQIDSAQYESGKGPCLDAWRRRQTVRVPDTTDASTPYPEFCRAALGHGIHSTLSLPLVADGEGLGALNLYAMPVDGFSSGDEALAVELTEVAAVLLANARSYWGAFELTAQLNDAMKSRAVIEQAKGILMARTHRLDADGAFDLLRQASQRENVKLREIAVRLVEGASPPTDGQDGERRPARDG